MQNDKNKRKIPINQEKELLGMFSVGLRFNKHTGDLSSEHTQITRQKKGRKTITEIRHEKTNLGNLIEELPDIDPDEIIINGKPW
jgi:hypothetical protein